MELKDYHGKTVFELSGQYGLPDITMLMILEDFLLSKNLLAEFVELVENKLEGNTALTMEENDA